LKKSRQKSGGGGALGKILKSRKQKAEMGIRYRPQDHGQHAKAEIWNPFPAY